MTHLKTDSVLNTNKSAATMNNRMPRHHVARCFLFAGLLLAAPAASRADEYKLRVVGKLAAGFNILYLHGPAPWRTR